MNTCGAQLWHNAPHQQARSQRFGSGKWAVATPYALVFAVWRFLPQFRSYQQQDAQELLRFLLDGMHNELNRIKKKPRYETIDCDKETIMKQSEIWWRYFRARDNSVITDIFEGQLCSAITCKKCGY